MGELYDYTPIKRVISNYEDEIDPQPRKKRHIINEEVAATCDRIGISDSQATLLIGSVIRSLGVDVNGCIFSMPTLRRKRMEFRLKFAAQLKENLKCAEILVVHWDGKLLPKITGDAGKVDRLPIVVTGLDTEQLLGVPELSSGTGENNSAAIIQTLEEWNLTDRIKAFCFDTTSSNTGKNNLLTFIFQYKSSEIHCCH